MLIRFIKPDFIFENENGSLTQLVHDGWKQFNIIESPAGSRRGGHYHKYNNEGFYVIQGGFSLTVWKDDETERYIMKPGDMFVIPPGVFHSFAYTEETWLASMYSRGVELSETEKDIWTE